MLVFSASETLFMVSMALCYFYSWQTYSVELTAQEQQQYARGGCSSASSMNKDVIVAVHISEVLHAMTCSFINCLSIIAQTRLCQMLASLFEPLIQRFQLFMIRNSPESKGYGQIKKDLHYDGVESHQFNNYSEIEVKDIKSSVDTAKISAGISSKSNSPPPKANGNIL